MNLAEMMRDMTVNEDEPDSLTDAQLIGRLKSIYELRGEKHTFTPGQIIRHKYPEMSNKRSGDVPNIFVRYLDKQIVVADHPEAFEDVSDWSSMVASLRLDCVIGTITNNAYCEFFVPSADYRPATEADYGPIVNID